MKLPSEIAMFDPISQDPVQDLVSVMPPACSDCWPRQRARAEMLGYFLYERIPTVKKAISLMQEQKVCSHLGPIATHHGSLES